jgi:hypothetical protein
MGTGEVRSLANGDRGHLRMNMGFCHKPVSNQSKERLALLRQQTTIFECLHSKLSALGPTGAGVGVGHGYNLMSIRECVPGSQPNGNGAVPTMMSPE